MCIKSAIMLPVSTLTLCQQEIDNNVHFACNEINYLPYYRLSMIYLLLHVFNNHTTTTEEHAVFTGHDKHWPHLA